MNPGTPDAKKVSSKLESWSFGVIVALLFLAPLLFMPSAYLPQAAAKAYAIIFLVLASCILYLISRLKARSFELIRHPLWYVGLAFIVFLMISSMMSGGFMVSFFGQGFEYTTAAFLIVLLIAGRLSATLSSRDPERVIALYSAVAASFLLLVVFAAIKLASPGSLSFGLFTTSTSTPIGSWYDLGMMSAVVFILLSAAFAYLSIKRMSVKIAMGVLWLASVFFMVLVNMPLIWFGLALVFLILAVHRFILKDKGASIWKRIPIASLVIFIAAAMFAWMPSVLYPVPNAFHAGYSEVFLPWQMTINIGANAAASSPWFGSGPNTFTKDYLLYKPLAINNGNYWSAEFPLGSGFVPTLAVSLGAVGIIMLCLFYVYFFRLGFGHLSKGRGEAGERSPADYISHSSFLAAMFLSYMAIVYTPSYANILLLVVLAGVFVGSQMSNGNVSLVQTPFDIPRSGAIARLAVVILLVIIAAGFAWYALKASALGYFARGSAALSDAFATTTIDSAKSDFIEASALDRLDAYDRAIVGADLADLNVIAGQISSSGQSSQPPADEIKAAGDLLADAENRASMAVKLDPSNYYDYVSEAQAYSAASTLGVSGAYDSAVSAYKDALSHDPYNPELYLDLAQLSAGQKDYDTATRYIDSALQLKSNYSDAVYLLVQVQAAQGDASDAIASAKYLVQIDPSDPTAYFELGLLQYSAADYSDATTTLSEAVSLNPDYANAQYYLGLSYSKVGDVPDAIAEFEALQKTNPDSADVVSILSNLKAGKAPFSVETASTSSR